MHALKSVIRMNLSLSCCMCLVSPASSCDAGTRSWQMSSSPLNLKDYSDVLLLFLLCLYLDFSAPVTHLQRRIIIVWTLTLCIHLFVFSLYNTVHCNENDHSMCTLSKLTYPKNDGFLVSLVHLKASSSKLSDGVFLWHRHLWCAHQGPKITTRFMSTELN